MGNIVYVFEDKAYINLTNQCPCNCTFCIRKNGSSVGTGENLWHGKDPSKDEVMDALKTFDFSKFSEVVFCGYGEPTMALDNLLSSAEYLKDKYPSIVLRLDTNGLSKLEYGKSIVSDISLYIDKVSISMNAPNAKRYNEVTRPKYGEKAFDTMLEFAKECKDIGLKVRFTVVDVLDEKEIIACEDLAFQMEIPLFVRSYIKP